MRKLLIRESSSWSVEQIQTYLRNAEIPIRVACLNGRGAPLICSLWYLFDGEAFWCATQSSAKIVRFLRSEPVCGFEIAGDAMPYSGVRGQGRAQVSVQRGGEILEKLIERYLHCTDSDFAAWLIKRRDSEVAIRIEPRWLTAWDFGARMRGAV